jgi:Subtilase family
MPYSHTAGLTRRPGAALAAALVLALGACDGGRVAGVAPAAEPAAARAERGGDLVTSDARALAAAVRAVGNENELLVMLKDDGVPGVSAAYLRELPLRADLVIGVPAAAPGAAARADGHTLAGKGARDAVRRALAAHGVAPYRETELLNVFAVRVPDDRLVPVLGVLLRHPNVDYVEANQKRPVEFHEASAGGLGRAAAMMFGGYGLDTKHTFHNVDDVWAAYTRGSGAKVGVMDSGVAYNRSTGTYDADLSLLAPGVGVDKRGFVDDYAEIPNCGSTGQLYYGQCVSWDDHYTVSSSGVPNTGHGTKMTGIVGANDNETGYVGVLPDGLTVGMKIAQNDRVSGNGCTGSSGYCIEDDDFVAAIDWAIRNDLDVLSMSFDGEFGGSVFDKLKAATNTYNIVLVASTDNRTGETYEPAEFNFVIAVAGLTLSGANDGDQRYKDLAAYSGSVGTVTASCPSSYAFCTPNGPGTVAGTSAATATVAGIAGLLRSYRPWETAATVRARLVNTAGTNGRVDALRAITY